MPPTHSPEIKRPLSSGLMAATPKITYTYCLTFFYRLQLNIMIIGSEDW